LFVLTLFLTVAVLVVVSWVLVGVRVGGDVVDAGSALL
jgi:hypothetical protein